MKNDLCGEIVKSKQKYVCLRKENTDLCREVSGPKVYFGACGAKSLFYKKLPPSGVIS